MTLNQNEEWYKDLFRTTTLNMFREARGFYLEMSQECINEGDYHGMMAMMDYARRVDDKMKTYAQKDL